MYKVPYGDPLWYSGNPTPYYNESHVRFRAAMREFVEKEITPNAHKWDEDKKMPAEIYVKAFQGEKFHGKFEEFIWKILKGGCYTDP